MFGLTVPNRADVILFPPEDTSTNFQIRWDDVALAPSETKTFVYFTKLITSFEASVARTEMESIHTSPDLSGLSNEELNSLQNFQSNRGNLTGETGSVVSGTTVTATTGDDTESVSAGPDGSGAHLLSPPARTGRARVGIARRVRIASWCGFPRWRRRVGRSTSWRASDDISARRGIFGLERPAVRRRCAASVRYVAPWRSRTGTAARC